ncbi:hypothetical protein [Xenorhabdus cabanillasii]|uniref:Uncharacterized protein n=1 Tax=Xenorhabdus cabanillasii JM26 TaxID=1427517 RepID=W1IRI7_9GAMM|nr:hypothetical protein [Xenorhabdus cabanillasii]PHM75537.1 hypothetical protein Xcab_03985 [Xenorhabdus cabanillasii JM26]CDL79840.1 hypothetical protein XCR1_1250017 [Xenorhabdus cabanillasii JM26]
MFSALLTAPDGTPWIVPNSTPLCLRETRIIRVTGNPRTNVDLGVPASTRCLVFTCWLEKTQYFLPDVYQGVINNRWNLIFQGPQYGERLKFYVFTDEEQRPPIGSWGACIWGENGQCILHHLSKVLAIKGVMREFPSTTPEHTYFNYAETIRGSVAVMATIAGYGEYLINVDNSHGKQILPVYSTWSPQALKRGGNTIIRYYAREYTFYGGNSPGWFSGITGKNVYIDTAVYD